MASVNCSYDFAALNRLRGTLFGLAVGDALGAAVEFKRPGTFKPVIGFRGGGPHGLAPGEWTDDTSMALALADGMAKAGWDLNDQASRYLDWWQRGTYSVTGRCFDIGITIRSALARFEQTQDASSAGDSSERASGNGSIMRLAPVSIHFAHLFPDGLEELARFAAESSLPTHASPQCLSACRYLALVLCGLMHGIEREEVLSPAWSLLDRLRQIAPLHPEINDVAGGSFRQKRPPEIVGSGYVVRSLEAALWAFHDAVDFREAVLRAVNLGDDADTTGAVCGQLAGAYWGERGIPAEWLAALARKDLLETAIEGLLSAHSEPQECVRPMPQVARAADTPPCERCFWVVPGRFLAGAYPGSPEAKAHRQRIEQLWQAGIRTFISLVEEHETNNSGEPFAPYDSVLQELAASQGETVRCLRFPVRDLAVPSTDEMRVILDAIDRSLAASRPVYLHCFGGVGRTGTAVCCWLLRHGLATPDSVLKILRELRHPDKATADRKAPENEQQIRFVMRWTDLRSQDSLHNAPTNMADQSAVANASSSIGKLRQLLGECWTAFDRLHHQPFVVRPAVPILFFGDSAAYFASPLKVITVGLNPSNAEFPEDNPFLRFPAARQIVGDPSQRDLAKHLEALNAYFRTKPYKQWFGSFEPILKGIMASYYDGPNTALHTDLCSPIATAPTWSRLPKDQRSLLRAEGVQIWHSLVEILAPDIIVVSVAKAHLSQIRFPFLNLDELKFTIDRKRPYVVLGRFLTIISSKPSLLVFGRAAMTPFGGVSNVKKMEIGGAIKEWYRASAR
jgi:ADP-ribosyl-[dinitrogen reductase] hydrolase